MLVLLVFPAVGGPSEPPRPGAVRAPGVTAVGASVPSAFPDAPALSSVGVQSGRAAATSTSHDRRPTPRADSAAHGAGG